MLRSGATASTTSNGTKSGPSIIISNENGSVSRKLAWCTARIARSIEKSRRKFKAYSDKVEPQYQELSKEAATLKEKDAAYTITLADINGTREDRQII